MKRDWITEVVELLERLLKDRYGIDAADVRTREVLSAGCGETGYVYRFDAQGVSHLWACGEMRITGDPSESPRFAIYLEAVVVETPDDWSTILDLLGRRFPEADGAKLSILEDDAHGLSIDLLLPLTGHTPEEIKTKLIDFVQDIEPTRAAILTLYPDLRSVAGGTSRRS